MVTAGSYIRTRAEYWHVTPCPFCGKTSEVALLRILSTYSLSCAECGEVVEGFELYQDQHGYLYTENHVYPKPGHPKGWKA